jgi:nitrite reductase (NO-forming)
MLKVEGSEQKDIYSGKISDSVYLPEGGAIQTVNGGAVKVPVAKTKEDKMAFGK